MTTQGHSWKGSLYAFRNAIVYCNRLQGGDWHCAHVDSLAAGKHVLPTEVLLSSTPAELLAFIPNSRTSVDGCQEVCVQACFSFCAACPVLQFNIALIVHGLQQALYSVVFKMLIAYCVCCSSVPKTAVLETTEVP
jgi:hypothetical protein